ncbi:MAG: hypothetical protein IJ438_02690 [Clostridia bacterium]|nr:hypothetical protein [Clostridia bacterium]
MKLTNKMKRRLKLLGKLAVIAAVLAAVYALYQGWKHGDVQVDMSQLTDQNMSAIAENWEKLVDSGVFEVYHEDENANTVLLRYVPHEGNPVMSRTDLYIINISKDQSFRMAGLPVSTAISSATYSRVGLWEAIRDDEPFGNCTVAVSTVSSACLIDMYDFHSDGTARLFDKLLAETLSIVNE